jgi:AcrR family transcriptional regulator
VGKRGRPPLPGRREEILDAAVRVMSERGIEALSLAQLAEALGFSTYALTYHFGTREELLAAVAEHVETRLQAEFGAIAAGTGTIGTAETTGTTETTGSAAEAGLAGSAMTGPEMAELVRRYWAANQGPGASNSMRLWLELVLIASRDPDRLPGFLDRAVSGWTRVIVSGLGDQPDAGTLAALVFATMTGLELLQLMQPGSTTAGQALEKLIDMFQRELRGNQAE